MFQLRIYTLRSREALERYAEVHWARNVPSLKEFGVTTHGIWTEHAGDANRLVALIAYPEGAEPSELTADYMASPEFAADMEGFDSGDIVAVDAILLNPTPSSPIH